MYKSQDQRSRERSCCGARTRGHRSPTSRGGVFVPGIARLSHAEAEVVELSHIDRIEGLRAGIDKIGRNVSEVVGHVVALGEQMELVETAHALAGRTAPFRPCAGSPRRRFPRL